MIKMMARCLVQVGWTVAPLREVISRYTVFGPKIAHKWGLEKRVTWVLHKIFLND